MAPDQLEQLQQSRRSSSKADLSLLDLPDPALAAIVRCSKQPSSTPQHPLLALSRASRDAVLSCSRTVSLCLAGSEHAPEARLLHRVCSTAPPGLELELDLEGASQSSKPLLQLLQPGVSSGGWTHVHELEVSIPTGRPAAGWDGRHAKS
jgi:hypothetical protein